MGFAPHSHLGTYETPQVREEKEENVENQTSAFFCLSLEVTHINSAHSTLTRASHMALTNYCGLGRVWEKVLWVLLSVVSCIYAQNNFFSFFFFK